ncbi:AtuA-related protein [Pseudomonas sp. NPDC089569]|uniref:AtuA-related protein n=1 Tax=Pseudomonas sp. NPDC089569 TaxID=3390722 RepID=UPI003D0289C1
MAKLQLKDLVYARSGDKGDISNIAVIAKEPRFYPLLQKHLTAERVKAFFGEMSKGSVDRYEVRTLHAMNFVLRNSLGGGATRSLRIDFTGKTMCQAILRIVLDVDENDLQLMH